MLDFNHQRATPIDKPEPEHRPRSRNRAAHMIDINEIVDFEAGWFTLRIDHKGERYTCLGTPQPKQHKYEHATVYNLEPGSIDPDVYAELNGKAFVPHGQVHYMNYVGPLTPREVQNCLEVANELWADFDLKNMKKRQRKQKEFISLSEAKQGAKRSAKK